MKNEGLVKFGKDIKKKRIDKDMSRKQLSENASLSPSYLGGVERGEKNPSLLTIVKIGKGLGESEFIVRF